MTGVYTIEELQKLTDPDALAGLHSREKLALLNRVLDSLHATNEIPLSQARLDLDQAHFRACDTIQASVIAGDM